VHHLGTSSACRQLVEELREIAGGAAALTGAAGFELDASTFSGSIRSDLPVTVDSARRPRRGPGRSTRAVVGDGSASVAVSTFSGNIIIESR
jgi:hypothetical protein